MVVGGSGNVMQATCEGNLHTREDDFVDSDLQTSTLAGEARTAAMVEAADDGSGTFETFVEPAGTAQATRASCCACHELGLRKTALARRRVK